MKPGSFRRGEWGRATYRAVWGSRAEQAYENAMNEVEAGHFEPYLAPCGRKESPEQVLEVLNAYLCQRR